MPDWSGETEQSCDTYPPFAQVFQDGAVLDTKWGEVTGPPCGWGAELQTVLEPGTYQVEADNTQASWSWTVQVVPEGESVGSQSGADEGCAGGSSRDPLSLALMLLLGALCLRRGTAKSVATKARLQ